MPPPARTPLRSATACPPPGTLGHSSASAVSPEADPVYVSAMRRTQSPRRDVEQIQPRTRRRLPCLGRTIRAVPSNPMEVYFEMRSTWFYRLPALTGLIFPIFGFVKGGGDDSAPTSASSGQQIAVYVFHHGIPNLNSLVHIELWVFASLMVFTLVLYSRLRPAEPKFAVAAQVAVAACVISIAIKLGSDPARLVSHSSSRQHYACTGAIVAVCGCVAEAAVGDSHCSRRGVRPRLCGARPAPARRSPHRGLPGFGLTDLQQVSVGIAKEAADLPVGLVRWSEKYRPRDS